MWTKHWKLTRDPFLDGGSPYVPLASHEEVVARLRHTIESGQRTAVLRAGAGLGKSRIVTQALAASRGPSRRIARAISPLDGTALFLELAEGLGIRLPSGSSRSAAWKALADAVRLCRWQRQKVILAIEDCQDLREPDHLNDLSRLAHLDPHPETMLTIVQVFRADPGEPAESVPWGLTFRLKELTRSEAEHYLSAKLEAAGREGPAFTPRAIHRLHALSGGNPRGLDRLASLGLMAGALRGLEIVPPELVEAVSSECVGTDASR